MPSALPNLRDRDKPVTIQQGTDGIDGSGAPTVTWATLISLVWMSKDDVSGEEVIDAVLSDAQAVRPRSNYLSRWTMPYQTSMDPEIIDVPKLRRLVYRGRVHDIAHARVIGDGAGIELTTMARTA